MATLEEVLRAALPSRDADGLALAPSAASRSVTWVRVVRARVPAFDALDRGDLVIVPSAALAVVAGTDGPLADIARALVRGATSAVLLVPSGSDDAADARLARLGEALRDGGATVIELERTDPVALERRVIAAIIEARPADEDAPEPPELDDDMPAYRPHVDRLLGELPALPRGAASARELLAPLLVGRPATQRIRLSTLRAVLETASVAEAADRLGVHRNTVAYRVTRLEERAGWDLADPDLRLALQVALRLVQDA